MSNPYTDKDSSPEKELLKRILKTSVVLSVMAAMAVYLLSGFYVVEPQEQALVSRFGKLRSVEMSDGTAGPMIVLPGTHYRLPYPIDRLHYLRPNEVKNVSIEAAQVFFEDGEEAEVFYLGGDSSGAQFLTGDENILHVALNVQYKIGNPEEYVFNTVDPDELVKTASETALTSVVARTHVDDLLTSGKQLVLADAKRLIQGKLESLEIGVETLSVNFTSVVPPEAVADAFKDVESALQDKDRIINEAKGDYNHAIHRARGEAENKVREAEGHKEETIKRAQGDTQRFLRTLNEYRQAGESQVTLFRLYAETMEEILPRMRKYVMGNHGLDDHRPTRRE
ncbi:FtsH protease activity modulator HflK [Candidatus Hydrogenedentota bacterium]